MYLFDLLEATIIISFLYAHVNTLERKTMNVKDLALEIQECANLAMQEECDLGYTTANSCGDFAMFLEYIECLDEVGMDRVWSTFFNYVALRNNKYVCAQAGIYCHVPTLADGVDTIMNNIHKHLTRMPLDMRAYNAEALKYMKMTFDVMHKAGRISLKGDDIKKTGMFMEQLAIEDCSTKVEMFRVYLDLVLRNQAKAGVLMHAIGLVGPDTAAVEFYVIDELNEMEVEHAMAVQSALDLTDNCNKRTKPGDMWFNWTEFK